MQFAVVYSRFEFVPVSQLETDKLTRACVAVLTVCVKSKLHSEMHASDRQMVK